MDQLEGCVIEGYEHVVCLLAKGIYGLRQPQWALYKKKFFPFTILIPHIGFIKQSIVSFEIHNIWWQI